MAPFMKVNSSMVDKPAGPDKFTAMAASMRDGGEMAKPMVLASISKLMAP